MNKVLIASPVSRSKNYCMKEFIWNIAMMDSAHRILLLNNSDPEYGTELQDMIKNMYLTSKVEVLNILFEDSATLAQRVTGSMNKARELAISEDCTHLFVVECDLFPHKTALNELLIHQKPVVGFPYFIGLGLYSYLCIQHTRTCLINLDYISYINSIVHPFESFMLQTGKLLKVHGIGLGCALISRDVLEKIPFAYADDAFHDTVFYKDCFDKEIPVYCDTSRIIRHQNQPWTHVTKIFN